MRFHRAGVSLLVAVTAACSKQPPPSLTPHTAPDEAVVLPARTERAWASVVFPLPRLQPMPDPYALRIGELDSVSIAGPVRICAGGDVLLGNNLDTTWALRAASRLGRAVNPTPDPDSLLAPLRPLVADADVVLVNIEGAIGEGSAPPKCRPGSTRCYAFRQPIVTAAAIRRLLPAGEVVGNIANNHAMDAGGAGFEASAGHLRNARVHVTGVDSIPTVVVTATGDTVVFLGFATAQAGPDPRNLGAVRRYVSRAAAQYRRVVVTAHIGAEGRDAQRTVNRTEAYAGEDRGNPVAFARTAIDAGASVVIGHGPHVMRAAEWYNGALVFYSLGNLLTYGPFNLSEPLNRGAVACVALDDEGAVGDAVVRSTWQSPPGVVSPDPSGRAAILVDSLSRLDFPTTAPKITVEGRVLRGTTAVPDRP